MKRQMMVSLIFALVLSGCYTQVAVDLSEFALGGNRSGNSTEIVIVYQPVPTFDPPPPPEPLPAAGSFLYGTASASHPESQHRESGNTRDRADQTTGSGRSRR